MAVFLLDKSPKILISFYCHLQKSEQIEYKNLNDSNFITCVNLREITQHNIICTTYWKLNLTHWLRWLKHCDACPPLLPRRENHDRLILFYQESCKKQCYNACKSFVFFMIESSHMGYFEGNANHPKVIIVTESHTMKNSILFPKQESTKITWPNMYMWWIYPQIWFPALVKVLVYNCHISSYDPWLVHHNYSCNYSGSSECITILWHVKPADITINQD